MGFRSGELGGQLGGSIKSGTFVCQNATVCFDLWDGAPSCWNVDLLPDCRRMSGNKPFFRTLSHCHSSMYYLLWPQTPQRREMFSRALTRLPKPWHSSWNASWVSAVDLETRHVYAIVLTVRRRHHSKNLFIWEPSTIDLALSHALLQTLACTQSFQFVCSSAAVRDWTSRRRNTLSCKSFLAILTTEECEIPVSLAISRGL